MLYGRICMTRELAVGCANCNDRFGPIEIVLIMLYT